MKKNETKNKVLIHLFRRSDLTKENAFLQSCTPIALCTKTISASSGFTLSFHDPFHQRDSCIFFRGLCRLFILKLTLMRMGESGAPFFSFQVNPRMSFN